MKGKQKVNQDVNQYVNQDMSNSVPGRVTFIGNHSGYRWRHMFWFTNAFFITCHIKNISKMILGSILPDLRTSSLEFCSKWEGMFVKSVYDSLHRAKSRILIDWSLSLKCRKIPKIRQEGEDRSMSLKKQSVASVDQGTSSTRIIVFDDKSVMVACN